MSCGDSTGVQATQTIAPIYASLAAGDYVSIVAPNGRTLTYTCQTTAVTLGDPTFQKVTDNTATGASLAAQINADPRAFGLLTAQASSGTVTVTITQPGTIGNGFTIVKYSAGGSGWTLGAATFAGGKNAGALQSVTLTLSGTIGNNETLVIGGVTLTGRARRPRASRSSSAPSRRRRMARPSSRASTRTPSSRVSSARAAPRRPC